MADSDGKMLRSKEKGEYREMTVVTWTEREIGKEIEGHGGFGSDGFSG